MSRFPAPAWRLWLLSTIFVLTAALGACQREQAPKGKASPDAPVLEVRIEPGFSVADNSGTVSFEGVVGNTATKTRLDEAVRLAYGPNRSSGEVQVDAQALPAAWADGMGIFLQAMAPMTGASVRFEGDHAVLTGNLDPAQRRTLRETAQKAFPGLKLQGLFEVADAAETALAAEVVKAADPVKLAKGLNQLPLRFEEGGGNVSADSLTLVASAAEAIRKAPPGTRLLIVGPVVASNDSGHDVFLSKQRAEALKAQLILNGVNPGAIETRGWGTKADGTPVEGAVVPPEGASMRFELLQ